MPKCLVCEQLLDTPVCTNCGFDPSLDYEHNPTFVRLPASPISTSQRKKARDLIYKDTIKCTGCGEPRFVINSIDGSIRCSQCGQSISQKALDPALAFQKYDKLAAGVYTVVAAGANWCGQCDVSHWTDIKAIAVGNFQTVGLRTDGTVIAVGGFGDETNIESWTQVKAIAASDHHTVGLREDGTVLAIGKNTHNRCNVQRWSQVIAVAAGFEHTVGLRKDGTIYTTSNVSLAHWTNIKAIVAGMFYTAGLREDGTVIDMTHIPSEQRNTSAWKNIVAIAVGEHHTVGLQADGTVVAAGQNQDGQCNINGWTDIVAIAAGGNSTAGLRKDGTVVTTNQRLQKEIESWKNITAIAISRAHIVGLQRLDG